MAIQYTCLGCGFRVFSEPPGTFEICPVCGWEDDNVQADDPSYQGGANGICLTDHQQSVLQRFPITIQEHAGFQRDPNWRPVPAKRQPETPPASN
jgi:hypothetical protein